MSHTHTHTHTNTHRTHARLVYKSQGHTPPTAPLSTGVVREDVGQILQVRVGKGGGGKVDG